VAHTNFATSWILSSILTVLAWLVCSSSSNLSLPRFLCRRLAWSSKMCC
jgi:hypothetical protein